MKIAHEICRWHHERYDGSGYPDGLVGDAIPISAQAVSIADVYDALTSERCYKKAYSHDEALKMILDGECGVFNPLLLECFKDIADAVLFNLRSIGSRQDFGQTSYYLANEALEKKGLYLNGHSSNLLEAESVKKEFFAERCRGIQFEYDAVLRRVQYIRYYNQNGEKMLLHNKTTQLLSAKDWERLKKKVNEATREKPCVEMTVLVPINGDLRWHKLTVLTVWAEKNASYVSLVGHFVDIHDLIISVGKNFLINEKVITGETFLAMRDIFDVVRIVDPNSCHVLKIDKNGGVVDSNQKCYHIWNRNEACKNCSSLAALKNKTWMSKLEVKDGLLYSVLSRYAQYGSMDCVLEVAFCIDDSLEKTPHEIGFYPDSTTLKNYYRDSLTKTYSRAYLESFIKNLETAQGVAIADIDDFKRINDTHGHIAGDAALRHIAKVIKSCLRKEDVVIRYGGDEFLLLFYNISENDFYERLIHIKTAVHESSFSDYPDVKHDISIGGSYDVTPFQKAIDLADKAMYKDKFRNKSWGD